MLLGQSQQQRLLRRKAGYGQGLCSIRPSVPVWLAPIVTFKMEVLAQHFQLALDRPQVSFYTSILELLMKLTRGDLPATRNTPKQFHGKQHRLLGIGPLPHALFHPQRIATEHRP